MVKRKKAKRYLKIIGFVILGLTILLLILNLMLRISIDEELYKNNLLNIYPEEFVNSINIYQRGIVPTFSSITLCNSIYLKKREMRGNDFIHLIVHEATHSYQGNNFLKCIKNSYLSLYHQFKSFLIKGSRNYAYIYSLENNNYNPEQEAEIVADYYYLKFLNGNETIIACYSCENYSKEEIIDLLESKYQSILEKYS